MTNIDVIGLDMDGVLVDLASYQIEKGFPYFSKRTKSKKVIKNINAYDIEDIFGVSHSERMKFWALYIWEYCLKTKPMKYASKMTNKWHEEGRKVKIITSRVYVMEDNALGQLFRQMVYYWLKKYNIYYDEVIFTGEKSSAIDKLNACKEAGVDLMVDDKVENVNLISENNLALCFNNPWNQEGLNDDIKKVNNFKDIDAFIKTYEFLNGSTRNYVNIPRKGVK